MGNQIELDDRYEAETILAWDRIADSCTFQFDGYGDDEISSLLKDSSLCNSESVLIFLDYESPIFEVPTPLFIEKWSLFFGASGYMGFFGASVKSNYLFEFTDSPFNLFNNFAVRSY